MMTLKDIKISRTRIPIQNALWLRPIGGFAFKLYYPHSGNWMEASISTSEESKHSSGGGQGGGSTIVTTGSANKVIAARCIPMKARVGSRYFFGDGRVKFKTKTPYKDGNGKTRYRTSIYTYAYKDGDGNTFIFSSFSCMPWLRKNNWKPIVVTIRDKDFDSPDLTLLKQTIDGKDIYYTMVSASTLNCETASPHLRIIDGHLRNVKHPRVPRFFASPNSAKEVLAEASNFWVRRLASRGRAVKDTKVFKFYGSAIGRRPTKLPFSIRRQWKPTKNFWEYLKPIEKFSKKTYSKVFMLKQIVRNRKSVESIYVRRASGLTKSGSREWKVVFKELKK